MIVILIDSIILILTPVHSLADPKVVKILVANKSDLSKSRTVTTKDGKVN